MENRECEKESVRVKGRVNERERKVKEIHIEVKGERVSYHIYQPLGSGRI